MKAIVASALLVMLSGVRPAAAEEVNRIVLRVNDRIATLHDFEQRRTERVFQIQQAELTPEEKREILADVGESILRQIYEELLLLSRADQLGVRASESEIERNFRGTVESLGIQNEEELAQALAASGMTEDTLRRQIRRGMVMQDVIGREVQPRVRLQEEEMRRYYRDNIERFEAPERWQVEDAVVLSSTDAAADQEVATEIAGRIASGEPLEDATRDFTELGKVTVIDLGWVSRGDLETSLEDALVDLRTGATSEPIVGRGGLHILQVREYEEVEPQSFPEVEEQIRAELQKDRFGNEMTAYLEELAESSYVATDPPPGAEGFQVDLGREVLADDSLTDEVFRDVPPAAEATSSEGGAAGDGDTATAIDPPLEGDVNDASDSESDNEATAAESDGTSGD